MELEVEVVYATPDAADAVVVRLPEDATLLDAIRASGMLERHPELQEKTLKVGVYGQAKRPESLAKQEDRIEIYRQLAADPKEARRQRVRRKRV